ncbi:MAG: TniQ family protein [Kaiparowitsia implicata GSE-PSE-MK54-09C]|jgi:ribosomal protein S27E|nr:TniQ family protein [Kaiparowitsia implicata GSE-PSE-MK54-09C]
MKLPRELPIAPRPEDDELLSSWQGRVACRYGLTHDDLSGWLGVLRDDRLLEFADRDFAPSTETVLAWAAACRFSERSVQDLALSSRSRSRSWYVWGEGRVAGAFRRPVCMACLDEDAAAGRDHHFRRSWALVETVICDRHHRFLEEACPGCLACSGFRFVFHDMAARLACVECGRVVGVVRSQGSDRSEDGVAGWSDLFAQAIDHEPALAERLMEVVRLLWKPPRPRTGRQLPFVADVLPNHRPPPSVRALVDQSEPLATAPIGWRTVTLLGAARLLDLGGSRESLGQLTFTLGQMVAWTEEREPRPGTRMAPCAPLPPSPDRLSLRSEAEYLELAKTILASDEWRVGQGKDARAQRRTLGALIEKALAGEPF